MEFQYSAVREKRLAATKAKPMIRIDFTYIDISFRRLIWSKFKVQVNGMSCHIQWNDWESFAKTARFQGYEISHDLEDWEMDDYVISSDPDTIVPYMGYYTCHLAINGPQIHGGSFIKEGPNVRKFRDTFYDAVSLGKAKGKFGLHFACPSSKDNLMRVLKLDQPMDIKLQACLELYKLATRRRTIASSIIWRMSTEKLGDGLHRTVVSKRQHPISKFKKLLIPVEEVEQWKDWLNVYEPYSQQKITAETSFNAKKIAWWIDMRVGKTPTGLMLMARTLAEYEVSKWVVVAPAINIYDPWLEELTNQNRFNICMLDQGVAEDAANIYSEEYNVYVVSYESLPNRLHMMQRSWDMEDIGVLMDETSAIKNPTSKRAKAVHYLTEHVKYSVALNGTPMAQGPEDVWSQQFAIDQGQTFGLTFNSFAQNYLSRDQAQKFFMRKVMKLEFELNLAGTSIRYIRSEADQFKGKDKGFRYIIMPPTEQMKKGTDLILEGLVNADDKVKFIKDNILTMYGHLRECCAAYDKYEEFEDSGNYIRIRHTLDPKIVWVKTFLHGNPGQSMVIFSEFSESEDRLMEMLDEEGIPYSGARPKGGTPYKGQNRSEQIRKFQEGETRVFLMKSTQAKGITLNRIPAVKAGHGSFPVIVYMQPSWSLINWEQSQDRCVGTIPKGMPNEGKSIHTQIYVLAIKGSIEVKIIKALRGKKKVAESLLADAERDGYVNPFADMDLSGGSDDGFGDAFFDAEEMDARYHLKLAPQRKLSEKMIRDADAKFKAKKMNCTQKIARTLELSEHAEYLLTKVRK